MTQHNMEIIGYKVLMTFVKGERPEINNDYAQAKSFVFDAFKKGYEVEKQYTGNIIKAMLLKNGEPEILKRLQEHLLNKLAFWENTISKMKLTAGIEEYTLEFDCLGVDSPYFEYDHEDTREINQVYAVQFLLDAISSIGKWKKNWDVPMGSLETDEWFYWFNKADTIVCLEMYGEKCS